MTPSSNWMLTHVVLVLCAALAGPAAADLSPPDYRAYHGQRAYAESLIKLRTGLNEAALDAARRAAELQPDNPDVLYLLGVCLLFDGQMEEARSALQAVIEERPELAEAHHDLGLIWLELGDVQAAAAAFGKVTELRPESWIGPYRQAQTAALAHRDWATCEGHLSLAVERGFPWLASLPVDPEWAEVAGDPEFLALVRRLLGVRSGSEGQP